jgi:hypothetical protein
MIGECGTAGDTEQYGGWKGCLLAPAPDAVRAGAARVERVAQAIA